MKRFVFPLDRVLRIRRLEMESVEAQLSELAFRARAERTTAEKRHEQAAESGRRLIEQADLRGVDFHITRHWLARLETERSKAIETSETLLRRHGQMLGTLVAARRKVQLLETLRERKQSAHKLAVTKQVESQASEFYLAKRIRKRR